MVYLPENFKGSKLPEYLHRQFGLCISLFIRFFLRNQHAYPDFLETSFKPSKTVGSTWFLQFNCYLLLDAIGLCDDHMKSAM